jgi:nitrogen-specific signal transduction histidine kinase
MGLGLAFCQRLVERNEGSIAFDPSSPFTRFFFLLPVSQGTAAENPDSPARKAA